MRERRGAAPGCSRPPGRAYAGARVTADGLELICQSACKIWTPIPRLRGSIMQAEQYNTPAEADIQRQFASMGRGGPRRLAGILIEVIAVGRNRPGLRCPPNGTGYVRDTNTCVPGKPLIPLAHPTEFEPVTSAFGEQCPSNMMVSYVYNALQTEQRDTAIAGVIRLAACNMGLDGHGDCRAAVGRSTRSRRANAS